VKAALKRPKTCQIVTLDWLEDSMLKGKRLDEEPYSHLRALKRERERERKRLMVIKGLEKAVREVNPSMSSPEFVSEVWLIIQISTIFTATIRSFSTRW
jgi:hypothetical protein